MSATPLFQTAAAKWGLLVLLAAVVAAGIVMVLEGEPAGWFLIVVHLAAAIGVIAQEPDRPTGRRGRGSSR